MMKKKAFYRITGISLIIEAALIITSQVLLVIFFQYPDTLQLPVGEILTKYYRSGGVVTFSWFCFAFGCLMMIPLAMMMHEIVNDKKTPFLIIGSVFGGLAGVFYVIGISRWLLLATVLSSQYVDPNVSATAKESLEIIFKAFDLYAGNGFGETFAPISHAIWLVILGVSMLKSNIFPKWMAYIQVVFGMVISMRPLEYLGLNQLGEFSDIGVMLWTISLFVMGVQLIRARNDFKEK